jgi:hypothetical protein
VSTSRTDTDLKPQPLWQRLKDRFVRYASEPDDPPKLKLRKLLGVAVFAVGMVVWPTYGALYLAIGARLPALICMLVVCMQALCAVGYVWLRNYMLLVLLLGLMHMLAFLGLHFAFGGFTSSPYLLVYALLMPLLAPFTMEPRHTKYWVAGAMVLVLIAGVGERFFSHGGLVSPGVLTLLTVSILLGFALFALVPALIYGQRTRAINQQLADAREAQLAQKAEHLAQTQAALERQTATAEVLQVISSSVSDAQPVLEKILDSCTHLFDAASIAVTLIGEDGLLHLSASRVIPKADAPAGWRTPDDVARSEAMLRSAFPMPLAGSGAALAIASGRAQLPRRAARR